LKIGVRVTPTLGSHVIGERMLWHKRTASCWPWNPEGAAWKVLRERSQSIALAVSSAEHRTRTRGMVFAGAHFGDGASTITLAVARVLNHALGLTPLVVEMNWQRPRLADRLDLAPKGSVYEMYKEGCLLSDCVQRDQWGLSVLPAGGEWPSAASAKLACRILQDAESDFDLVLFDAPPLLESADAIACGTSAKEMIVVVRAGVTSEDDLLQVKALADGAGVLLRGSVLTMAKPILPRWLDRFLAR
jgi:polysaccharide biosynthesis transport protein